MKLKPGEAAASLAHHLKTSRTVRLEMNLSGRRTNGYSTFILFVKLIIFMNFRPPASGALEGMRINKIRKRSAEQTMTSRRKTTTVTSLVNGSVKEF